MDTLNWMRDNLKVIGKKKPWEISLPGTHDSGFFNDTGMHWVITDQKYKDNHHYDLIGEKPQCALWFRCQEVDIYEQLKRGIRCLDLRIAKDRTTGKFVFFHGGITADGQELSKGLQDLLRFTRATTRELVVVQMRTDDTDLSGQERMELRHQVLDVLQDVLVKCPTDLSGYNPLASLQTDTFNLEQLTSQGSRIWLLSSACRDETMLEDAYAIWCGESDYIDGTWQEYQSDFAHTPCQKIEGMEKDQPQHLKTRARQAIFKHVDLVIWTVNLLEAATTYVHPKLKGWIDAWAADPALLPNLNIINIDYFNRVDWFMDKIVELNQKSRGPIVPAKEQTLKTVAPMHTSEHAVNYAGVGLGAGSAAPFFDVARMRKMLGDLGLDWHKCLGEYQKAGNQFTEPLLAELAAKGIYRSHAQEFMDWYQKQGKQ